MINIRRFFPGMLLALCVLTAQVGPAVAAAPVADPSPVSGLVQSITLEANTVTGVTLVSVDLVDEDGESMNVRLSLESALALGLVELNSDGKPVINTLALGKPAEIAPSQILPDQTEGEHPVGSALATFFSTVAGIDYETVMSVHEQGVGFGVIAQALWLTTRLEGNVEIFEAIIAARQSGDFSAFVLEDGSTPENWGQLKKAILEKGEKNGLGTIISNSPNHGNENGQEEKNEKGKEKEKEKEKEKGKGNGEKGKGKEKEKKK